MMQGYRRRREREREMFIEIDHFRTTRENYTTDTAHLLLRRRCSDAADWGIVGIRDFVDIADRNLSDWVDDATVVRSTRDRDLPRTHSHSHVDRRANRVRSANRVHFENYRASTSILAEIVQRVRGVSWSRESWIAEDARVWVVSGDPKNRAKLVVSENEVGKKERRSRR